MSPKQLALASAALVLISCLATLAMLRVAGYLPPPVAASASPVTGAPSTAQAPGIDELAMRLALSSLTLPQRRQVLESADAFAALAQAEALRLSVVAAARDAGVHDDPVIARLMQRAQDRVLFDSYLGRVVSGNLDPAFPDETQLASWFAENAERFGMPETMELWQLFLPVPADADEATIAAVQERAVALARDGRASLERFEALAREHSAHGPTAARGGALGRVDPAKLVPAVTEAVAALEEGEVSEPIRTPGGFHIVRRGKRTAPAVPTLEAVHAEAREALRQEARLALRNAALRRIGESYPVAVDSNALETWRLEWVVSALEATLPAAEAYAPWEGEAAASEATED